MYKDDFSNLDELLEAIKADKEIKGANSSTQNRYPIRFVLFDNFKDSYEFIRRMITEHKIGLQTVQNWIDSDYPDLMITHQKLTDKLTKYIKGLNGEDKIITPFSELARFYDNNTNKEFDTLIKTIKAIETNDEGWEKQQRIYLPIVGLEGKMSSFFDDSQTTIWYMRSSDHELSYHLIVTNQTTYGVQNLEECYVVKHNMFEWLNFWKQDEEHSKKNIICTSKSMHANAEYAQPDNAFTYCKCDSVYDFLTSGLGMKFPGLVYRKQDEAYWQELAEEIDIKENFDFDDFFSKHFSINSVVNYKNFIELWFKYNDEFSRWLLTNTVKQKFADTSYLKRILNKTVDFTNLDLFTCIALDMPDSENDIEERLYCLKAGADRGEKLTEETQVKLKNELEKKATESGYLYAMKLFSPISDREKELAIRWLGEGKIKREDVKHFYPDLYYYLEPAIGTQTANQIWALDYINNYKEAKIADNYTENIAKAIEKYNGSQVEFLQWWNCFKSTKAHLMSRQDIDIYYWIDGLGIDWIPFIAYLVEQKASEKVFLNDVTIARALLPTVTSINKVDLEQLIKGNVKFEKIGDIDQMAHQSTNIYPSNIIREIETVKKAVNEILRLYTGKKIAIISDHGMSYLSQLQPGLNLAGFESHHYGRYARRKTGSPTADKNYHVLEDGKTVCALNHHSLCAKIPSGEGAHGGCTPEEVLVPILIISSSPNSKEWSVQFMDDEIDGTNPVVHVKITGLTALDSPKIIYDGKAYSLINTGANNFVSESIKLNDNNDCFELRIGETSEIKRIPVNTGTKEEDLFGGFGL